jgi:hypothetical protein
MRTTNRPWTLSKDKQGGVEDGEFLGWLDQLLGLDGENLDVLDNHSGLHLGNRYRAQSGQSGENGETHVGE